MRLNRRAFLAAMGLAGLSSCARIEQSRLGQFTPDLDFRKDGPLRFAVVTSPQLLDSRSVGIVGRAVNLINNDDTIAFVVVVGNLTTHGSLPEMNLVRQAFQRLKVPAHYVPGPLDRQVDREEPLAFYRRTFEKLRWRMNAGGWTLIGLDSVADGGSVAATETLVWLREATSGLDAKRPVALFTPAVLVPGATGRSPSADAMLEPFRGRDLRLVVSGAAADNHGAEHDGVLFVSSGPCSTTVEPERAELPRGFCVITLDGATIQHEFVDVPL